MAATTKFSILTKTLSIRLERDPAVESLLLPAPQNHDQEDHQAEDKNSSSSDCVICGKSGLRNSKDLQQHREEKEHFKSILIDPQLRSRMSSKAYAKFQENFTTCISCWAIIYQVWTLHKEMAAIQLDIDELVEEVRQKTVKAISQDIEKGQKVQKVASSIPVNEEITPRTGKEPKKSKSDRQMMSAPKLKSEDGDAAEDFNNDIKKEEDSEDVKVKKEEDEITDHHHEHCRNKINIRQQQILSRRLTLRSLSNVRRCGGRKKSAEKPGEGNKIRNKGVPISTSTPRKIKPSIEGKLRTINANGERLSCSKCGKVLPKLARRIHHELQKCKVHYNAKELVKWKHFIHKCTICGHFFGTTSALQGHIHAHKGVKPFCCPKCKKGFTQKVNMEDHYKNNRCFSKYKGGKSTLFIQNTNCDDRTE